MPLIKQHKATILSNKSAGRGYFRLLLKAPEIAASGLPGQFVMLRVTDNLDPLLARPFGIHAVHAKSSIEILYRVAGKGTSLLTRAEKGKTLTLTGPLGNGFTLPGKNVIPLLIAGGSGFPPLHFLSLRAGANAQVFVGARNRECLPPAGILKSFKDLTDRVHIATEDGSAGRKGMSTDILSAFLSQQQDRSRFVLYACGPHAMLAAAGRVAAEHAVPCFVSTEERMACGLGACMGCSVPMKAGGYKRACKEGPVFDSREIEWAEQVAVNMRGKVFGVRS